MITTLLCYVAISCAPMPQEGASLADVYERVRGSVVTIRTISTGPRDASGLLSTESGVGSGVLVTADGKIMTASHVVQTADRVVVEFLGSRPLQARVVSSDVDVDVALIQLEGALPEGAVVAELANSDDVRVGSSVFVVGAPLGIEHTLTAGHLSARRKDPSPLSDIIDVEHFQTDAAIHKGNSGGPMFDMQGRVIGIVSHILSAESGSTGLGFAVTSNICRTVLLEQGPMWSGIDGVFLSGDLAAALNLPEGQAGLLVQNVAKESLGERLGLRTGSVPATLRGQELMLGGDIILEVAGEAFGKPQSRELVRAATRALPADGTLKLVVLRGGKRVELEAPLNP